MESIIDVGHVCCMDYECEIEDITVSIAHSSLLYVS